MQRVIDEWLHDQFVQIDYIDPEPPPALPGLPCKLFARNGPAAGFAYGTEQLLLPIKRTTPQLDVDGRKTPRICNQFTHFSLASRRTGAGWPTTASI